MEYTKGKWNADLSRITGHSGISIDADDTQIANVYLRELDSRWEKGTAITRRENTESLANAHLIAAAPDLYEALTEWLKSDFGVIPKHIIDKALKARAKAEGDK